MKVKFALLMMIVISGIGGTVTLAWPTADPQIVGQKVAP
ncbi:MAG: hypothetical protein ACI9C4_002077 [Paraglaciecola sp.]|jgi:hypothetical protein